MKRIVFVLLLGLFCLGHSVQSQQADSEAIRLLPREFKCEYSDYPAAARRANTQGVVIVRIVVGEANKIESVEVQKSSGETREHKMLDQVSLRSARTCAYSGGTQVQPGPYILEHRWSIQ